VSVSSIATSMTSVLDMAMSFTTVDEIFKAVDRAVYLESGDCIVVESRCCFALIYSDQN
jgi:hypothetical protein